MPGMDGFELLSRLRKLPNGQGVPVLALTGFGRAEDVERATSQGFFSHITKPVDVSDDCHDAAENSSAGSILNGFHSRVSARLSEGHKDLPFRRSKLFRAISAFGDFISTKHRYSVFEKLHCIGISTFTLGNLT